MSVWRYCDGEGDDLRGFSNDGEGNGNGSRAVESARGPSSELAHSRPRIIFENVSACWPCQQARENGQNVRILLLGIIRRFDDLFQFICSISRSRHNIYA